MNELGKRRVFGKPIVKGTIPGGGRYRSPSGEVHRGRLMQTKTDCGKTIGQGWTEEPAQTPVTCKLCKGR